MKPVNNQENSDKCVCPNCPSYNKCMTEKMEKLFCAISKAVCAFEKRGCICGACPVKIENHLISGYYCKSGAEI